MEHFCRFLTVINENEYSFFPWLNRLPPIELLSIWRSNCQMSTSKPHNSGVCGPILMIRKSLDFGLKALYFTVVKLKKWRTNCQILTLKPLISGVCGGILAIEVSLERESKAFYYSGRKVVTVPVRLFRLKKSPSLHHWGYNRAYVGNVTHVSSHVCSNFGALILHHVTRNIS